MRDATVIVHTGTTQRTVPLSEYLTSAAEEQAHAEEYGWIKRLRHLQVDGDSFRDRFRVRADSLWWFTELYLHKQRSVLDVYRSIAALEALIEREHPSALSIPDGAVEVRHVASRVASSHDVRFDGAVTASTWWKRLVSLDFRARKLTLAAHAAPDRLRGAPTSAAPPDVAAFIHRAFWRTGGEDGAAESYIGPVLEELERRADVYYVGVGPVTNFRSRRRWTATHRSQSAVVPVERFAPSNRLGESRAVWRRRYQHFRTLTRSKPLRAAAVIRGVDCWPVLREQLAGVAWLQWPWSVRAMDEAAAALDALEPKRVLTYAEAGGWGRALMLEARRRGIPSAGLQHGFIYRHWLNYLHEPDEVRHGASGDDGFPSPTVTLLFDEYAARHLRARGHFRNDALRVTGSPRLDALMRTLGALTPDAIAAAKRDAGVADDEALVLVTTKERESRQVLPALVAAVSTIPGVRLAIKAHPAETERAYDAVVAGRERVAVLPAATPLAPLLAASRAVVTVNSTVALDAAVAGIPALVIAQPNNLSPFVDAGVLAGASTDAEIPGLLKRILYDEGLRQQLADARRVFLREHAIGSDGMAAQRSADAVLQLARGATAPKAD